METHMLPDEIIVSKTDPKGRITYANDVFSRISGYRVEELLGKPHNLIRHPDMPRGVFRLLWDRLLAGQEVFAYVVNQARNGDHYWVLAHVTPTHDAQGRLIGCHSNRRAPNRAAIETLQPIYRKMLEMEKEHSQPRVAAERSRDWLLTQVPDYDRFIFSLPYEEE